MSARECRPAEEPPRRWLSLSVERGRVYIDQAEPFECESERRQDGPRSEEMAPKITGALEHGAKGLKELAEAIDEDPKNRTVRRVLARLEAEGVIRRDTEKRWTLTRAVSSVGVPKGDDTLTPRVSGVSGGRTPATPRGAR